MSTTGFKDYLDDYLKLLAKKNRELTLEEYAREDIAEADRTAARRQAAVLGSAYKNTTRYGKERERMLERGLGEGYAAYLKKRSGENVKAAFKDIASDRAAKLSDAYSGYESYLKSYKNKEDSSIRQITEQFTRQMVLDPETVIRYSLERGLSAEGAERAAAAVYDSVKGAVKKDIIDRIYNLEYTPETAASYAALVGLKDEDIAELVRAAEDYHKKFKEYSKDYLKYLEDLSDQSLKPIWQR
ncbi:MAG: hypothetical protein IKC32_04110 [Clostridia bacterium]|nr:hypothetical protein [Clostridia bacterium]